MKPIAVAVCAFLLGACGTSEETGGSSRYSYPGQAAGGGPSESRSGPRGGVCPTEAPVVCGDLCCEAGAVCATEGCTVPTTASPCAAGATVCPVAGCSGSGCEYEDSSTQNNDAVSAGGTASEGQFAGGVAPYTGCVNTGLRSGALGLPVGADPVTIELWVRLPDAAPWSGGGLVPLFTYGSWTQGSKHYRMLALEPDLLVFYVGSQKVCQIPFAAYLGGWNPVAVTFDGLAVKLYTHGSQGAPLSSACELAGVDTDHDPVAFFGPPGAADGLGCPNLEIDEVRVSKRVRTPTEIQSGTNGPFTADADTVGLWHFDSVDATVCCPSGSSCLSTPGGTSCLVGGKSGGTVDPETGCTTSHPEPCDDSCCLLGASCSGGECGCPPERAACGTVCCGEGASCKGGECQAGAACADEDYPNECGESCCADGFPCVDGRCACGGDHPVVCDDVCCLAGAECDPIYSCACPAGWTGCGIGDYYCCSPDEECVDGFCRAGGGGGGQQDGGGGGSCPGGWMGSLAIKGSIGIEVTCEPWGGEPDMCIDAAWFESQAGVPLPASCNPEGGSGCMDGSGGWVRPCCPGLYCVIRSDCGASSSAGGGQCLP